MKKIEQALPAAIAARKELTEVTRAFSRATKNIVALEARLAAAHAELDGLVIKAQAALKAANTSGKVLSAKPVKAAKAVPTTKPAKVVAKPLPKPTAKAGALAAKPATKAEKAAAKPAVKAKAGTKAQPAAKVAAKPAAKKVAKKATK